MEVVHQSFLGALYNYYFDRAPKSHDPMVYLGRAKHFYEALNAVKVEPRDNKPIERQLCDKYETPPRQSPSESTGTLTIRFDGELLEMPWGFVENVKAAKAINMVFGRGVGGNGHIAFQMIDTMKEAGVPTKATVLERAASAHALLFLSADKRDMRPGSKIVIHSGTRAAYGTLDELRAAVADMVKQNDRDIDFISEQTGLPVDVVEQWIQSGDDIVISSDEAKVLGLVSVGASQAPGTGSSSVSGATFSTGCQAGSRVDNNAGGVPIHTVGALS